jgi:coenzyme PQQ precursor peptide PqqA
LEHGAVEGKQIAKGEKVTAVVPGVEKGGEIAAGTVVAVQTPATTIHNIPNALQRAGRTAPIFPMTIDFRWRVGYPNQTLAVCPQSDYWGVIMEWTAPAFEEVCLNCEINSYASAKL